LVGGVEADLGVEVRATAALFTGSESGDCFSGEDSDSGRLLVCEVAEPLLLLLLLFVLLLLLLLFSSIGVTTELTEGW
jgi:hypothetical protein